MTDEQRKEALDYVRMRIAQINDDRQELVAMRYNTEAIDEALGIFQTLRSTLEEYGKPKVEKVLVLSSRPFGKNHALVKYLKSHGMKTVEVRGKPEPKTVTREWVELLIAEYPVEEVAAYMNNEDAMERQIGFMTGKLKELGIAVKEE